MTLHPCDLGISGDGQIYRNLPVASLVQAAIERGEGTLTSNGALDISTGKYTGRSPKDRFIVDSPSVHDSIAWGSVNQPISKEKYIALKAKVKEYLCGKTLYVFDGYAGADSAYAQRFRIINEYASQNLFVHQLLIRPYDNDLENFSPDYNIISAPGFTCEPGRDGVYSDTAIIIDLEQREILIAGNLYCGELKKSIFSVMNYVLPQRGVLPMHCSANTGKHGDTTIFFGLSGTGKTTLSSDPERTLIGDDEHGWSPDGVFNIEGGCYAKCINLKHDAEPEIFDAIKFGTVLENVVLREDGTPDFCDASKTDNTRAGYPISYIDNAMPQGKGGQPRTIIFLTADAFGVLPPISRLSKEAAMYHFISGYTSKLAGTERGVTSPIATFSSLFGEPFFPRSASMYASMLGEKLERSGARVFLVNTGWSGGHANEVPRINLKYTRAMVAAAIAGELDNVAYRHDPIFNVDIPQQCPGVPSQILNTEKAWASRELYLKAATELAENFSKNFREKHANVPLAIRNAGPRRIGVSL